MPELPVAVMLRYDGSIPKEHVLCDVGSGVRVREACESVIRTCKAIGRVQIA